MAKEGTIAFVAELPMCDVCKANGDATVPALYDSRLKAGGWAMTCLTHYTLYGTGKLGVGLGQRLAVEPVEETVDTRPGVDCQQCGMRHPLIAHWPCYEQNLAALIAAES